jgi:hypothetical protein
MIPEEWIKIYVDQLLAMAEKLPYGALRDACLLRADHAMDMVRAWREHERTPKRTEGG